MSSSIQVQHNFESGHRLPHLSGKCESLHGHSWWATVEVTSPAVTSVVVEFGKFKAALRQWIDNHLDHGLMLGQADPLARILPEFGKVYLFGADSPSTGLDFPTVENVATLIARVAQEALESIERSPGSYVSRVEVTETHVNRAVWTGNLSRHIEAEHVITPEGWTH